VDFERIYDKLESIDNKLDGHMLSMENRVTGLEEKHNGLAGHVRIILGLIISGVTALIAWVGKTLFH